uniref:Predicted protein n=1 Tax=Hordeum vulgare subsp. vulgare TaxID=112509 RepID=F2E851_HORVV|nr:predicted protein [Hordeum vulgare subsp. vulgare]BAK08304.1 predicted protein [Hordeum vulgare subsp. vulgare]
MRGVGAGAAAVHAPDRDPGGLRRAGRADGPRGGGGRRGGAAARADGAAQGGVLRVLRPGADAQGPRPHPHARLRPPHDRLHRELAPPRPCRSAPVSLVADGARPGCTDAWMLDACMQHAPLLGLLQFVE